MMSLLSKKKEKEKNLLHGTIKLKAANFYSFFPGKSWGSGGWGGGKWPKRVIKIMKITSPCQVDVPSGLKLPAIKVKLSEKLLPAMFGIKRIWKLPHLITKYVEKRKVIHKGKDPPLATCKERGLSDKY